MAKLSPNDISLLRLVERSETYAQGKDDKWLFGDSGWVRVSKLVEKGFIKHFDALPELIECCRMGTFPCTLFVRLTPEAKTVLKYV